MVIAPAPSTSPGGAALLLLLPLFVAATRLDAQEAWNGPSASLVRDASGQMRIVV
eukprot:COSAG03_NODE_23733_length_277_cov_1.146067_1_plen_54_part_10